MTCGGGVPATIHGRWYRPTRARAVGLGRYRFTIAGDITIAGCDGDPHRPAHPVRWPILGDYWPDRYETAYWLGRSALSRRPRNNVLFLLCGQLPRGQLPRARYPTAPVARSMPLIVPISGAYDIFPQHRIEKISHVKKLATEARD